MTENELFGNSEQLNDTISRAAAINAICEDGTRLERQGKYTMTMAERKQRDADILDALPSAQPSATDTNVATTDSISRQAAIDGAHAMPDFEKVEKVIIDNLYIGDKKVTDLIASGRLRLVGFCEECKHCFPPLVCKVDGEVVQVTSDRCSICNGYVEKNGWCYKFEMRTDMRGEQDG